MFNKRWKKILAWSLSVVLVLVIGGLFAANYAVDKLMTSMAESLELDTEDSINSDIVTDVEPIATPQATPSSSNSKATPDPTEIAANVPKPTIAIASEQPETVQSTSQTNGDKTDSLKVNPASETTQKKASKPTSAPTSENDDKSENGYSAQVSADKTKQIQENVTVKEKADVASIVLGQLSVADIKRLQELASGGLTLDEKREARQIILGKVSAEQYDDLSQIAKKYGVSRGLSHDEVVAEEQQLEALEKGSE
ncbi:hypothetical protein NSS79_27720 [Paenibacillus sp. FSL L8-0436]|uniref:hypothetical protein n=1 Tax=Paenibacillus sp. FSL L8-0436 TaxID=2954686 RepID=UPI0031587A97